MLIPSKCGGLVDRPALSLCLDKGRTSAIVNARPGMRMQWFLLMLLAMLTLQGCVKSPTPIPPGTDTYFYGYLTEGGKFGVKIGDSLAKARGTLPEKYYYYYTSEKCDSRLMRSLSICKHAQLIDGFGVSKILKNGHILILYRNDMVIGIAWEFDWLPPMDF